MSEVEKLIELARVKFGELSEAEVKLFEATPNGEFVDRSAEKDEDNDPAGAANWGKERVIRAGCIEWLCTDRKALKLVTHKGIQVKGVRVDGILDLGFVRIGFPLVFWECGFTETINLQYAEIQGLYLNGTYTCGIIADGLKVDGEVNLRDGFKAEGEMRLLGATIGGNLDCNEGEFINKMGEALSADGVKVESSILLGMGFKAEGEVNLVGAIIGGDLSCRKGEFINEGKNVLNADRMEVGGSVFLCNGFKAEGEVRLIGATIGGSLDCSGNIEKKLKGGEFINSGGRALIGDGMKVEGSVYLRNGFKAEGVVRLVGATINGNLECDDSEFINKGKYAFIGDGMKVGGNVFLRNGFRAEGHVRLLNVTIGGNLDCGGDIKKKFKGGQFINPGGIALSADRMEVGGSVFMNVGFKAEGEVRLLNATINGNLSCRKGEFINPGKYALVADRMKVEGNVYLRDGFKAEGEVELIGAEIKGGFVWTNVKSPEKAVLNLQSARIGTLWDDKASWPGKGKLFFDGLVYERIDDEAPRDAERRIKWLQLQDDDQFRPGPYEQLAEVLRKSGHERDAKKVLIAKNEDRVKRGPKLVGGEKVWYRVFGPMIGYGYRPWRALKWVLLFIVLGWVLFWIGDWDGQMTPPGEAAYVKVTTESGDNRNEKELSEVYPTFQAFVYSVDTFVPLVDLHQTKYWLPNANRGSVLWKDFDLRTGGVLRLYMWIHIAAGWVLTTLLIVGLTGLVKK